MIPPLHANQSEGCPDNGEAVQGGVSGPLQLWQGLHWGDCVETQNENEGAPGCLSEGGTGEVGVCRACMGKPQPDQVGGDLSG